MDSKFHFQEKKKNVFYLVKIQMTNYIEGGSKVG